MRKRIALLGIYHESNTFIDTPTTGVDFEKGHWFSGDAIRREYARAHHEIGGIIEVLDACPDMELIPVLYAEATPGGTITAETYRRLLDQLFRELENQLPVDGCMVVPHGAGVSEAYPDMDGHWLTLLREKVGKEVPIVGTLDPHANLSEAMVAATDALIAYATNPHVDQRETGQKAARLLVQTLRGEIRPLQQRISLPMAISIEQQYTSREPCQSLYELTRQLSRRQGVLATSVLLGFPYADVAEMGASFLIVTDNDAGLAEQTGRQLSDYILERKEAFNGLKQDVETVLPAVGKAPKPVLFLDMGDNIGGGSPGDSTVLLEALERTDHNVFICLNDPRAVQAAQNYPLQDQFFLEMGKNPTHGRPYGAEVTLVGLADGKFSEETPRHGGQAHFDMGEIALVRTKKGNTVMLTSLRTPPFSLKQLTAFGVDPAAFDIVVAKGVNAPLAAYGPVCPTVVQVDTPGVTQANMILFSYKNRRRPLFPFEP